MLEKTIQSKVISFAKSKGCLCIKLRSDNMNGIPDWMVLHEFPKSMGRILFIEFKRKNAKPTVLQEKIHFEFLKRGHMVHIIDNINDGVNLINAAIHGDLC